ncbi:replication-associated recombination protein A [Zongyangia hominis]|uniref:Replication-associated recombination protein A n=1 Tax=Zongyangia hominis TaxID=2763677 RepID=A0A926EF88_9FIRM|nr:replication-associated recombination protein A [Zongyangia hominis]MBC8570761.1 replication-associated recombination protein A [Zongyangia hominis]
MSAPLADRMRPQTLDEVVGQRHLIGKGAVLRRIVESGQIPNMIFYGPSGIGKTTVARIIAQSAGKQLFKLNGTTASTADIKDIVAQTNTLGGLGGILLYLDEIQYLNKKQQQTLLEFIENGSITLISSTTENPYFYVYNAILSRSTVFEFQPVTPEDVAAAVKRAFTFLEGERGVKLDIEEGVIEHICLSCGGDVRKSLNAVELCVLSAGEGPEGSVRVTLDDAKAISQRSAMRYDRDADEHYDILSAFQKSIRGSDPDAAVHYLARLLTAGDLLSPCRRMLVTAAEDIGLAYPQAIAIVKACVDAALQLGLPEARIPLTEAVILLATAPKSNSAIMAIDAAMSDIKKGGVGEIPAYLKDGHYAGAQKMGRAKGYVYPHVKKNHWYDQQYLPDPIKDKKYYAFGDNKTEQAAFQYWQAVKGGERKE